MDIKYGPQTQQQAAGKNLLVTINFYQKLFLPIITWNKNHSSKPAVPTTYILGKQIFAAATFEGW